MDGAAIALFVISLIFLIISFLMIAYSQSQIPPTPPDTSSGIPIPATTWIDKQCPVGCTCFPNASTSSGSSQVCAYLSNDVMLACPPECCTPSCI